jgi:hypothetical protein
MPNKNPYTNPNSISNSGAYNFTNQKSKIFKLNMNLIENGDLIQNFLVNQYNNKFNNKNYNSNTFSDVKIENDFITILQNQRNNVKLNKLK